MDERFQSIVEAGCSRKRMNPEDCEYLLSFDEISPETVALIEAADSFVRKQCNNKGEIAAQIGIIVGPCYADCAFCSFAASTTDVEDYTMGPEELTRYLREISSSGIVSKVSLMTIHNIDFGELLGSVRLARSVLPESIEIAVNTGDLEYDEAEDLFEAGARSAYHAFRLGESIDNWLEPRGRIDTMKNLKKAGFKVATGVEPIGPEHTSHEIAEHFFRMFDLGCDCCSASRRECVPGTRLFDAGEISERRLLQIRSALLICSTWCDRTEFGFYGGFYGGFNRIYAEYGGSPKDLEEMSEKGLMRTVDWARGHLESDGFSVFD